MGTDSAPDLATGQRLTPSRRQAVYVRAYRASYAKRFAAALRQGIDQHLAASMSRAYALKRAETMTGMTLAEFLRSVRPTERDI